MLDFVVHTSTMTEERGMTRLLLFVVLERSLIITYVRYLSTGTTLKPVSTVTGFF